MVYTNFLDLVCSRVALPCCADILLNSAHTNTYGSSKYGLFDIKYGQLLYRAFEIQEIISVVEVFLFKLSYALWFMVSRAEIMYQS